MNRNSGEQCHYELHAKTAKDQMIREIQRLRRQTENLQDENDSLEEHNDHFEQIISSLNHADHGTEILQRLKRGESHRAIAEWLRRGSPGRPALSPTTTTNINQEIEQYHKILVQSQDPRFWTDVTTDPALIKHLITLYFTWLHPTHMLFDEHSFLTSFSHCIDVYCSSAMVNAICAASCPLLHNAWPENEETQAAIASLKSRFSDEARTMMKDALPSKMTTIQTCGILFLVEVGSGRALVGGSHLRLATELLLAKKKAEQAEASEEITAWGILSLHT